MKKSRRILILLTMIVTLSSTLYAQLPEGSIAPNFSMKKLKSDGSAISDTVCTLYDELDAGRAVYLDFSAVWCSFCWNYHTTHSLDELYLTYGPNGTNEAMVYMVEGSQGTIAQLNGGSGSLGNWVSGTVYPILPTIAPNTVQIVTDYAINNAYPRRYIICPDRTVKKGYPEDATKIITRMRACPVLPTNLLDVKIHNASIPNTVYCGSILPKLVIRNYGTTTLTSAKVKLLIDGVEKSSYDWTGSIAHLDTISVALPVYTDATLSNGSHSVKLIVDSPNNGTDENLSNGEMIFTVNNVNSFGTSPVAESFVASTFPPVNWSKDDGVDGKGWTRSAAHGGCAKIEFFNIPNGAIDYLILPPVDMSLATSMIFNFKVAYAQYNASSGDKLEVQVSSDCGATWTSEYSKEGTSLSTTTIVSSGFEPTSEAQWRQESVNLSSYAGQPKVIIRYKAISNNGNNAYVDEINLDIAYDIQSNEMVSFMSLSPNPSNSNTNLEFYTQQSSSVSVVVVNAIGAVVYSSNINAAQGFNSLQIPSESFNSGIYFVSIKGENSNSTQKLIIQK